MKSTKRVQQQTGWDDLTQEQRAAADKARALVADVVSSLPGRLGRSATLVTRAIASSPSLKAAYHDAHATGDELLAKALAAVAGGTIGRFVDDEASPLSASVLAIPLVSESKQPDGEWSQAVLATMTRVGLLRGPNAERQGKARIAS